MVAVVGGLLLIGLGFAVRVLQRIEQAIAIPPMPRPARLGEPVGIVAAPDVTSEPVNEPLRVPFPRKPESRPHLAPVAAAAAPLAEDRVVEQLRERFATLARLESATEVVESDVAHLPQPPAHADEEIGQVDRRRAANGRNGAAAPGIARLDVHARPASAPAAMPERSKVQKFDTFWPKRPRPARQAQPAPAESAAAPDYEPEQNTEPTVDEIAAVTEHDATPGPISILKSGVVDGMAYTLYSDGSIEAQLPQGTLRFGSITELRNHIEQGN
jgi:hypothetical protein